MAVWVWLVACSEFGIDPIDADPPPVTAPVEDRFVQDVAPAVDVLFVVDDTPSMAAEQAALAVSFRALAASLDAAGVRWQVGVTTTTMNRARGGWLVGAPYVIAASAPGAADAVAARLGGVGLGGSAPEAGIAAAMRALDLAASGPNRAFRRPDAALHVVFVSDGDDASEWLVDDAVDTFAAVLASASPSADRPSRAHAITGPGGGCVSDTASAGPAPRYLSLVAATGGSWTSICEADPSVLSAGIAAASVVWPVEFPLSAPPSGAVSVAVDDAPLADGFVVLAGPPRLRFDVAPPQDAEIVVRYLTVVSP